MWSNYSRLVWIEMALSTVTYSALLWNNCIKLHFELQDYRNTWNSDKNFQDLIRFGTYTQIVISLKLNSNLPVITLLHIGLNS